MHHVLSWKRRVTAAQHPALHPELLPQVEAGSYDNIALSLGTDAPADILFATDNEHEAAAAIAAGWQVLTPDLWQAASGVAALWLCQESVKPERPHPDGI